MPTKNLSVHHRDDGTTYFEKKCMMCGKISSFTVPTEKYGKWMSGHFVQDVFPEYSVDDREKMVSGTCSDCFDSLFPPDEDECNGACLTAYDVGLDGYPGQIAVPHPDCPIHGDNS